MRAAHLCVAATSRPRYERRRPEQTTLYRLVQQHYETFVAAVEHAATGAGLPQFVKDEFDAYLDCGILARGFIRLRCEGCARDIRVAFSCKRRGICPSCGTRRMAETAAYLVQVASCTYRIAAGPRAGRKVLSLRAAPARAAPITQQLCANAHGFSLHAGVRCAAEQRSELEQLCRYVSRPAAVYDRPTSG